MPRKKGQQRISSIVDVLINESWKCEADCSQATREDTASFHSGKYSATMVTVAVNCPVISPGVFCCVDFEATAVVCHTDCPLTQISVRHVYLFVWFCVISLILKFHFLFWEPLLHHSSTHHQPSVMDTDMSATCRCMQQLRKQRLVTQGCTQTADDVAEALNFRDGYFKKSSVWCESSLKPVTWTKQGLAEGQDMTIMLEGNRI